MISRYALCLRDDSDSGADGDGIIIFGISFNFSSHGDGVIDRDFTVGGLCLLGVRVLSTPNSGTRLNANLCTSQQTVRYNGSLCLMKVTYNCIHIRHLGREKLCKFNPTRDSMFADYKIMFNNKVIFYY